MQCFEICGLSLGLVPLGTPNAWLSLDYCLHSVPCGKLLVGCLSQTKAPSLRKLVFGVWMEGFWELTGTDVDEG